MKRDEPIQPNIPLQVGDIVRYTGYFDRAIRAHQFFRVERWFTIPETLDSPQRFFLRPWDHETKKPVRGSRTLGRCRWSSHFKRAFPLDLRNVDEGGVV